MHPPVFDRNNGQDEVTYESRGMPHEPNSREPLANLRIPQKLTKCCGIFTFLLVTLVLCFDIATDIWLTVVFGLEDNILLVGACVLVLALTSIVTALVYIAQMRRLRGKKMRQCRMAGCLFLNVPLQLGIVGDRFMHFNAMTEASCSKKSLDNNKTDWVFAKLKLVQSIFESVPMIIISYYSSLMFEHNHLIQKITATTSFISLVMAAAMHEIVRKERLHSTTISLLHSMLIYIYKLFILLARVLAMATFVYFYREWFAAIIVPHFVLFFVYFFVVYREVWKVDLQRVLLHSCFCILAYFPLNNEYRPDGEILIYYIIFTLENILMVTLMYGIPGYLDVHPHHRPGSLYHTGVVASVILFTFLGLIFMSIYYFCVHRSHDEMTHNHCSWFRKSSCCREKPHQQPPLDDSGLYPPSERRIYLRENASNYQQAHELMDESAPPGYMSGQPSVDDVKNMYPRAADGVQTPLTDSDYKPSFAEDEVDASTLSSDGNYYRPPRRYRKKGHEY